MTRWAFHHDYRIHSPHCLVFVQALFVLSSKIRLKYVLISDVLATTSLGPVFHSLIKLRPMVDCCLWVMVFLLYPSTSDFLLPLLVFLYSRGSEHNSLTLSYRGRSTDNHFSGTHEGVSSAWRSLCYQNNGVCYFLSSVSEKLEKHQCKKTQGPN